MEYVLYLDNASNEMEYLISGSKTMIIKPLSCRNRKQIRIDTGDTLYFTSPEDKQIPKAKATVYSVFNSGRLSTEESKQLVESYSDKLMLDNIAKKRLRGKRSLTLISIKDFEIVQTMDLNISKLPAI
jgi:hypothetical protein